jgi:integrase
VATIENRKGVYSVRWRTLGGHQKRWTCSTREIAKQVQREIEDSLSLGRDWQPQGVRTEADLAEVTRAYIENRSLRLRPRTLRRYAENLDLFIRFLRQREGDGALPVSLLSRPLMEDFYTWLCQPENGLHMRQRSADTARKIAEVAQLCWQWADESERFGNIPRPKRIEMLRSAPPPVMAPTWAEMDACLAASRSWHHNVVLFLRYTGLRVGESMLLEWRDVNLELGTLTIRPETSKTGNGRVIPLSPHLVAVLGNWEKEDIYLIPSGRKKGDRYRQARARDIARAWERAGVRKEVWDGSPDHAFRRGFKSGLLALGAHPDAIDYLQGHSLGKGGARARYIDPWAALPLKATVQLIPTVGSSTNKPHPRQVC